MAREWNKGAVARRIVYRLEPEGEMSDFAWAMFYVVLFGGTLIAAWIAERDNRRRR